MFTECLRQVSQIRQIAEDADDYTDYFDLKDEFQGPSSQPRARTPYEHDADWGSDLDDIDDQVAEESSFLDSEAESMEEKPDPTGSAHADQPASSDAIRNNAL
ncbi:hypothetical protein RvY_02054 [Ramazzottius varieornatus]|uniref:Uncharacterized protein n=1 Tax=Ramazzottius varieornatus TaxID=947166 RepID=A0A1D1ULT0_RAMVA|nr:hypothetical protein RvY_02054 [Ramazzottius varieornatus]